MHESRWLMTRPAAKTAIGRLALLLTLCAGATTCTDAQDPANPHADALLFIGNSLTYSNDLPALVQALAALDGRRLDVTDISRPDYSLEDHLRTRARGEIARRRWRAVIYQQGPSAAPESRVLLRQWSAELAELARDAGATPAIYMVWPALARDGDFVRVIESYRLAAHDANATLLPVGEAWLLARGREGCPTLYGGDGFHPSPAGSYLAALVIYARLFGRDPRGLPSRLVLRSGKILALDPAHAIALQQAASEVLARSP